MARHVQYTLSTCLGLGSLALDLPLSTSEVAKGLVPPAIAYHLFHKGVCIAVWDWSRKLLFDCAPATQTSFLRCDSSGSNFMETRTQHCANTLVVKCTGSLSVNAAASLIDSFPIHPTGGVVLIAIIVFMAVTSSGSAEFLAVSSLFSYDIWKCGSPDAHASPRSALFLPSVHRVPDVHHEPLDGVVMTVGLLHVVTESLPAAWWSCAAVLVTQPRCA